MLARSLLRRSTVFGMACLLTLTPTASFANELCDVIKKFEAAPPPAEKPAQRRWLEYHWGFDHSPNVIWSWGCRHSGDGISRSTCQWLKNNSSREFTMTLPLNIMACYGYKFPKFASYDWSGMLGTIKLHGNKGRTLILDLNYHDLPQGESAIRLAVEVPDVTYENDLPPIAPMPPSKDTAPATKP